MGLSYNCFSMDIIFPGLMITPIDKNWYLVKYAWHGIFKLFPQEMELVRSTCVSR